jgi:hypothetical protein
LGYGKFKSHWEEVKDSELVLDFLPIIDKFSLNTEPFVLEHWQAKPHGLRKWGLYCASSDNYYSVEADYIKVGFNLKISKLQIDERLYQTRPTAVVLYSNARVNLLPNSIHYIN